MCCKQGLISLPKLKITPPFLKELLDADVETKCSKFKEQIRIYNSIFQFTSIGGVVDNSINQTAGPYVFKLSGQNYRRLGSLLPTIGEKPKFAQLYMVESNAEIAYRLSCFGTTEDSQGLDKEIICGLTNMLNECNEIVFRTAKELHEQFKELPRVILPASFIPGPRYMFEKYQDAMAICRYYGYPNLFITFTCNPRWPEISDALRIVKGQRPEERPNIVSRVFHIKLRHLIDDLTKKRYFGNSKAVVYTVEFQKRGLPHVHVLLWLQRENSFMTPAEIDNIVSAELPNKEIDTIGYEVVTSFMLHGPCGTANLQAPCMVDGKCKKIYPKQFRTSTTIDEDGFPQYRRRDTSITTIQKNIELDNRFVIPHNVDLIVRYQSHINVEICNRTRAVKYLFKYISKGPDRVKAVFETSTSNKIDEVQNYLDCRYLSAYETLGEIYFLRLLLNEIKGPKTYDDLRTIDGITYQTYREACFTLGLLGDDNEWSNALMQAAQWATGAELQQLFVTIILFCEVGDKKTLFLKNWHLLADDIQYRLRKTFHKPNYKIPDEYLKNYLLVALKDILHKHSSSLQENDLPLPQSVNMSNISNHLFQEEMSYNINQLQKDHLSMLGKLNQEQLIIYAKILETVNTGEGGMFFVYGHGGTEKTFLWNTIISKIRSEGKIVLVVASSGIASLLLPGGRTTHSRFKILVNIDECSTCQINKQTQLAQLIEQTTLIVWDEAPMIHRHCLEALSKTVQDLLSDTNLEGIIKPFGGKTIILGGDFRQTLPVIQHGTRSDIINAAITHSHLWKYCTVFKLKTNMRLQQNNLDEAARYQLQAFADWLLKIGDGNVPSVDSNDDEEGDCIEIPQEFLIQSPRDPIEAIIDAIYQHFDMNYTDANFLRQRAIITTYNETVDKINEVMIQRIKTPEKTYLSLDYISKSSTDADAHESLYSIEFLNTLKFTGISNHELTLKVGCAIMLISNISQANGLCNGTRLIVTQLCPNIIEARIISGSNIGEKVYIPRIIMSMQNSKWPFIMCKKQFPIRLSYAMTINKSQGQTLDLVGLYLPRPVFSHGQLYVALSRVTSSRGLKILILDNNGKYTNKTRNVVYREIFENI
ncbi:DNA helicase protein [Dioscorea alata]|uniref:DNA helicase protein n=1 Tax=Dioscorea alata TaxID=55571 RepID=A0ACB7VX13_DIOAL|nr:DNA helicase protein [Dioscorea alata]